MSTVYGSTMAEAYLRGRNLRAEDMSAWLAAAAPFLPGPGGRILDLGAGTGRFTAALGEVATVIACEPSAAMRAVFPGGQLLVGGSAEAIPLAAASFEAVWASQMVHHVKDLEAFAGNVRRVLKPGGHLLLRGGFGELPLTRWFPEAFAADAEGLLGVVTARLAEVGLTLTARIEVGQRYADSAQELVDKVRTRSLSNLAVLADDHFADGLRALEQDAPGLTYPLDEQLELVVFG
ncbi:class I SAM-dependent methyltransferase [Actinoplanes friuliensis]|nr:class I SAM-dependent methyltransferase [Actinoplanes friuliensis]